MQLTQGADPLLPCTHQRADEVSGWQLPQLGAHSAQVAAGTRSAAKRLHHLCAAAVDLGGRLSLLLWQEGMFESCSAEYVSFIRWSFLEGLELSLQA
jgi:hypothetical protein